MKHCVFNLISFILCWEAIVVLAINEYLELSVDSLTYQKSSRNQNLSRRILNDSEIKQKFGVPLENQSSNLSDGRCFFYHRRLSIAVDQSNLNVECREKMFLIAQNDNDKNKSHKKNFDMIGLPILKRTFLPTPSPTAQPDNTPSDSPSVLPTCVPTTTPSSTPSDSPSVLPTCVPTDRKSVV